MKSGKPVRSRLAISLIVSCAIVLAIVAGVILYLQASAQSKEDQLRRSRAVHTFALSGRGPFSHDSSSIQFGLEVHTNPLRRVFDWARDLFGLTASSSTPPFSLHTLIFSNSVATDADLIHLAAFPELKRLSLGFRGSRFTNEGLEHLKGLHNLTHLDLSGMPVTHKGLGHLKHLRRLEVLDLTGTGVRDEDLAQLTGLPNLKKLRLPVSNLTEAGLRHLSKLKGLKHLHLWGPHRHFEGLEHLSKLELEVLTLSGRGLTDREMADINELKSLRALGLQFSSVTDAGLVHLTGLKELVRLNVQGCEGVTDAGLQHLAELQKLQVISVYQSAVRLTEVGLAHLSRLEKLRSVTFYSGDIGEEASESLLKTHPEWGTGSNVPEDLPYRHSLWSIWEKEEFRYQSKNLVWLEHYAASERFAPIAPN